MSASLEKLKVPMLLAFRVAVFIGVSIVAIKEAIGNRSVATKADLRLVEQQVQSVLAGETEYRDAHAKWGEQVILRLDQKADSTLAIVLRMEGKLDRLIADNRRAQNENAAAVQAKRQNQ